MKFACVQTLFSILDNFIIEGCYIDLFFRIKDLKVFKYLFPSILDEEKNMNSNQIKNFIYTYNTER